MILGLLVGTAISVAAMANDDPFDSSGYVESCFVCHAANPTRFADPRFPPPKIAGQSIDYLLDALRVYRDGERNHYIMSSQAVEVPYEALPDLAATVSAVTAAELPSHPAPVLDANAIRRGEVLAREQCVTCHDPNAAGGGDRVPMLNGQHPRYFQAALLDYRLGVRRSAAMTEAVIGLSDRDERDLAAYFASLPGLYP